METSIHNDVSWFQKSSNAASKSMALLSQPAATQVLKSEGNRKPPSDFRGSSMPSIGETCSAPNDNATQYRMNSIRSSDERVNSHNEDDLLEWPVHKLTPDMRDRNSTSADGNTKIGGSFRKYLSSNTRGETERSHEERYAEVKGPQLGIAGNESTPYFPSSSYPASQSPAGERGGEGDNGRGHHDHHHQQQHPNSHGYRNREGGGSTAIAELEESFNAMLMAWYQSGYATGRYQALLEISKKDYQPQPQSQSQEHFQMRDERPSGGNRQEH